MLFLFLKYLQPTHYFQLYKKDGGSVLPIPDKLPKDILDRLEPDTNFKSENAKQYDLSWQAIQKGYIGDATCYTQFESLPIDDEYRFIRKQFHPAWVFYVLCMRLLTFHNPFKEIKAWWQCRNVKRIASHVALEYPEWGRFKSSLIEQKPLVSVVIPTLNRYDYLKDVLQDFEQQDYRCFEIIVVDQSEPFQENFYKDFNLTINVIRQEEKALWLARNTAIQAAKGEFIALSEDDVRISADWLTKHLKALDFFDAQVSAGVFYPEGSSVSKERSFFSVASQFATGNAMLYKSVFEKIGLFDRQFEKQRMGDGEFGLRAYLNGYKSVSNPYASCIDVKAATGGLRQMGSWDAFRPKKLFAPRPIPSVLYFFRKYFGRKRAVLALFKSVPLSIIPYRYKKNKKMLILGALISVFLLPFILIQVIISWRLASKKLREGEVIERLEVRC